VAPARRQPEGNTLDLPLLGAAPGGQPAVNAVDGVWLVEAVARAIDATTSRKAAGFSMEIDKGQLARQLQGDGHLSMLRVGKLDRDTLLALADEIRKHCGVVEDPREGAQQDAEAIAKALCRLVARVR
jgi:hypothetical protein